MGITTDQIDLWCSSASEPQNLEFKKAKNRYDAKKLCRYRVSQIVTATIEQELVKNNPNAPDSRRYARYVPAWA